MAVGFCVACHRPVSARQQQATQPARSQAPFLSQGLSSQAGVTASGPTSKQSWESEKRGCASALAVSAAFAVISTTRTGRRRQRAGFRNGANASLHAAPDKPSYFEILKLDQLGKSPSDKALAVNLDPKFYGSFAEIGAGQEVSRTFLKAGAAAGTVARSISAYDMRMSDVNYGKAKRYVTLERLQQMLVGEYDELEKHLRETRGEDTRFFAFASTLAARAYMSDRECEGWVGLTYQAEVGQARSTVSLHVRMSDPTAQLQGEAIGELGTNLIYLCHAISDPYLITSFLLDGAQLNDGVDKGRLEIDFIDFSGPAFPEGSVDQRLLALRMVQLRLANAVLLQPDEHGKFEQSVPNNAFYKRPIIVERSRFAPVTFMHQEVMDACTRKLKDEAAADERPPMQVLEMQVDDITQPVGLVETEARISRIKKLSTADNNQDGFLQLAEVEELAGDRLSKEEVERLFGELDVGKEGRVAIDALFNITGSPDGVLAREFLDRFEMLEQLRFPVLISRIRRTHKVAVYLSRYTQDKIVVAVGGGAYSIERALFSQEAYASSRGGMLEAFGRLFAKGHVKVWIYPNIDSEGNISPGTIPDGDERLLYEYLVSKGAIENITKEYMSESARDPDKNEAFRFGSQDVRDAIGKGTSAWEKYVPDVVAKKMKSSKWFHRLSHGTNFTEAVYKFLNDL